MKKIEGEVECKPLSINKAFQGRRFKSKEYIKYEKELMYLLPKQKERIDGKFAIHIDFYVKNVNGCDVDNFVKCFLDILKKAEYIKDDRYMYWLSARKHKAKAGEDRIKFKIEEIK